jgi:hypothetical protein
VTPNYETLFCAGHTWASDGNLVAAGGDMGEQRGGVGWGPLSGRLMGPYDKALDCGCAWPRLRAATGVPERPSPLFDSFVAGPWQRLPSPATRHHSLSLHLP